MEDGSDRCNNCMLFNCPCTSTKIINELEENDRKSALVSLDLNDNIETLTHEIEMDWYNEYDEGEEDEEAEEEVTEDEEEYAVADSDEGDNDDVEMEDD